MTGWRGAHTRRGLIVADLVQPRIRADPLAQDPLARELLRHRLWGAGPHRRVSHLCVRTGTKVAAGFDQLLDRWWLRPYFVRAAYELKGVRGFRPNGPPVERQPPAPCSQPYPDNSSASMCTRRRQAAARRRAESCSRASATRRSSSRRPGQQPTSHGTRCDSLPIRPI
jgi:hypothetical protein